MSFPWEGRRRGGRWLTELAARWLVAGSVPAWCAGHGRGRGEATGRSEAKRLPGALVRFAGARHASGERVAAPSTG